MPTQAWALEVLEATVTNVMKHNVMKQNSRAVWEATARGIVIVALAGFVSTFAAGRENDRELPPFSDVEGLVRRHFDNLTDYKPGDIIARSEVEPLFDHLRRIGFPMMDRRSIINKVPSDSDFLVQQLRTREGRKYMRAISSQSGAYDRLDHIRWLRDGQRVLHRMIRQGDIRLAEYLASTQNVAKGSKQTAKKQDASKKSGKADFNKPTGRIYTVEMLVKRLRESYDAAAGKAETDDETETESE